MVGEHPDVEHRLKRLEHLARRRRRPDQARSVEEMTDEELAAIIDPADPAAVLSVPDAELERATGRRDKVELVTPGVWGLPSGVVSYAEPHLHDLRDAGITTGGNGVSRKIMTMALMVAFLSSVLAQAKPDEMRWVQVSKDKKGFVFDSSGRPFVPWGFNYDHDDKGRLIEDYWEGEWPTVEAHFGQMKKLGANVVRVHLQLGKVMDGRDKPNAKALDRLGKLLELAERLRLYLDLTGLGCYQRHPSLLRRPRSQGAELARRGRRHIGIAPGRNRPGARRSRTVPAHEATEPRHRYPDEVGCSRMTGDKARGMVYMLRTCETSLESQMLRLPAKVRRLRRIGFPSPDVLADMVLSFNDAQEDQSDEDDDQ
jgi:hypothetical protein